MRDRKPFVRFAGKAYVLPRTGQRGIPVLSVNTSAVAIAVYRIGDRNLLDTVLGSDFQRNLSQYDAERIASEHGAKVWSGELAVDAEAQCRSHHRVSGRPGGRRPRSPASM